MALKSLLPFYSGHAVAPRATENDAFFEFRRDMNRVFDEFMRGVGLPSLAAMPMRIAAVILTPRIDVSETDNEVRVAAELPGIDENDIEVTISDDVLIIRAAKKIERDDKERDFYIVERTEGTFFRSLAVPFAANSQQVDASVKDGVLTITVPKPKEARDKEHRIEVKRAEGGEQRPMIDRAAAGDKPSPEKSQAQSAEKQRAAIMTKHKSRTADSDLLDEAGIESFPASDPPGWIPVHVGPPSLFAPRRESPVPGGTTVGNERRSHDGTKT